jgi:hypothetical protein
MITVPTRTSQRVDALDVQLAGEDVVGEVEEVARL